MNLTDKEKRGTRDSSHEVETELVAFNNHVFQRFGKTYCVHFQG
jgi:hypothetical protein